MKLKRFNKETIPTRDFGSPKIAINSGGAMSLNKPACELMGLDLAAGVEFLQDEENPKNWYVVLNNKKDSIKARRDKDSTRLIVQNSVLAKRILKAIDRTISSAVLLIGCESIDHDGEKLWPIITSSYKPKNN